METPRTGDSQINRRIIHSIISSIILLVHNNYNNPLTPQQHPSQTRPLLLTIPRLRISSTTTTTTTIGGKARGMVDGKIVVVMVVAFGQPMITVSPHTPLLRQIPPREVVTIILLSWRAIQGLMQVPSWAAAVRQHRPFNIPIMISSSINTTTKNSPFWMMPVEIDPFGVRRMTRSLPMLHGHRRFLILDQTITNSKEASLVFPVSAATANTNLGIALTREGIK